MNSVLISIILVPIIEIYLFIKIGGQIGAFNTISLIFITAIIGIIYARYEGLNTIRSGFSQLIKNEIPAYEIIFFSLSRMQVIISLTKSTVTFKILSIFLCSFIFADLIPINVISAKCPL